MPFANGANRKVRIAIAAGQKVGTPSGIVLTLLEDAVPAEMLDADGANPCQNGGGDLRAYADEGLLTRIPLAVIDCTTANDPLNATLELKLNIDDLDSDAFWLTYNTATTDGQPAKGDAYGQYAVFPAANVAAWGLHENPAGGAPQFEDLTGGGNSGTVNGGMTSGQSVSGQLGRAVNFDGANDYVDVGDKSPLDFGTGDFSLLLWLQRDANAVTNLRALSKGCEADGAAQAGYVFAGGDTDISFIVNPSGTRIPVTGTISVGPWYFIAGVVNRASSQSLYIDGGEVASTAAPVGSVSSANSFFLGRSSTLLLPWDGRLDDVRAYSRALSAGEVATLHNCENDNAAFWEVGAPEASSTSALLLRRRKSVPHEPTFEYSW